MCSSDLCVGGSNLGVCQAAQVRVEVELDPPACTRQGDATHQQHQQHQVGECSSEVHHLESASQVYKLGIRVRGQGYKLGIRVRGHVKGSGLGVMLKGQG